MKAWAVTAHFSQAPGKHTRETFVLTGELLQHAAVAQFTQKYGQIITINLFINAQSHY